MGPDFLYAKGRILSSIEFILKEMEDFDKHFPEISWDDYRMLDTLKAKAMEKTVENILTALIETAGTIAVESEKIVESYAAVLTEAGLIIGLSEDSAITLGKLASMRNRRAHRYLDFKFYPYRGGVNHYAYNHIERDDNKNN